MTAEEFAETSRDALIALILEQHATIGTLQQRISTLEKRLAERGGPGMPGNKPTPPKPARPPKVRQKRAHGYGRSRLPPTDTVQHAYDSCPDCGMRLLGGWVQATREVIEVPVVPAQVTEHQYIARVCPLCRKRQVPAVDLTGVVLGTHHRLGLNLVSLITTLREEGRLPFGRIQWYLATFHRLHLSVGELVRVVQQVAQRAIPAVATLRETIAQSPVVQADETGWREHGHNGYVWTFSTPTTRYFVRRGRGKEVVDEVLGTEGAAVVVSDFYAAYHHYPGIKQRCWAHLLREIHDLKTVYPADTALANWAAVVLTLYHTATAVSVPDERRRVAYQRDCETRLLAACTPFLADPIAVQAKLCRRIQRHLHELFVFVADPRVPATNNAAERSLRHLVTSRKISGGTHSERGTTAKMTLASLFGTWRLQGHNPFTACYALLQSPAP
jgi:transposase